MQVQKKRVEINLKDLTEEEAVEDPKEGDQNPEQKKVIKQIKVVART